MRTRTFVLTGIFTALLIAGVGSYWASTHPDGLMHVAQQAGFSDTAKDSAANNSPLSGYEVKGVGNHAVSRGLAGVVGALVVLTLAGGLTYAVRRKGPADQGSAQGGADDWADDPADDRAGDPGPGDTPHDDVERVARRRTPAGD